VADGLFKSIEEGYKTMVKLKGKYEPQPEGREVYEKLYKVYYKLYDRV